jgi:hypothetical protein
MTKTITAVALAGLLAGSSMLAGCGERQAHANAAADKYAGLDEAIRGWRTAIEKTDAACSAKGADKGCQSFEVACKGERAIEADDQARGVSAKVVVAMQWQGWNAEKSEFQSSPGFAEFSKVGGTWRRQDARRVNLTSCA